MYNYIVLNPETGRKVSIYSKKGKQILKNFLLKIRESSISNKSNCPKLTNNDKMLLEKFKKKIKKFKEIFSCQSELSTRQIGGSSGQETWEKKSSSGCFTNTMIAFIIMVLTALAMGATTAFFMEALSDEQQRWIISLATGRVMPVNVCRTTLDYTLGAIGDHIMIPTLRNRLPVTLAVSCSERAEALEQAINNIRLGVAGLGIAATGLSMSDRIRHYLYNLCSSNLNTGGQKGKK